ncbi:hemerythrin domain-containing protein [Phytohabitans sp. LJ34]|uniref:hemerythrin domain-containing protein n=1 Tax=Phytohabitans sp. LJ34 TaxID=3452217 RepID=UPI003F8A7A60
MAADDAVTLIEKDHRALEALFDRVTAGDGDRDALIEQINVRLAAHSRAEEAEVYPAIVQAQPGEEEDVEHAHHEHHEAEHLLRKARNLTVSPHFDEAFQAFVGAVRHHVEEEEQKILPALRKAVDQATLEQLGAAFEQARTELLGDESGEDLGQATKTELYEMAKEAEIPGRSTMTKDELAEALRDNE